MEVLGKNVLVEQILLKKDSPILHTEEKPENDLVYSQTLKVLEIGPECPETKLKVGDVPVTGKWAEPLHIKLIEGNSGDYKIVRQLVFAFDMIVAIDNP